MEQRAFQRGQVTKEIVKGMVNDIGCSGLFVKAKTLFGCELYSFFPIRWS